ncbi:MAG: hypothetical protein RSA24_00925 [Clostridia bacterium]
MFKNNVGLNKTNTMFTAFGTPEIVIINGEKQDDVVDSLTVLQGHIDQVLAFALTRINGIVKLCVTTF